MLDTKTLAAMWDMQRKRHGITVRLVESLPADAMETHPVKGMRSVKELVVHMYGELIRGLPESLLRGEILVYPEKEACAKIGSKQELLAFMADSWTKANEAVSSITDAQLQAQVKTPWNMSIPGAFVMGLQLDEYVHHRGQLYAFARALGVEPVSMWDFAHNAPEFQPAQGQAF